MVTWEDVQKVYPNIPLKDLRGDVEAWENMSLDSLEFEVITHGARWAWSNGKQRMYLTTEPCFWPFQKGEILLAWGVGNREPFGPGRKSSKWNVESRGFATYDEAKAFSDVIKAAPAEYAGDEYDDAWVRTEYGDEKVDPDALHMSSEHNPYYVLMKVLERDKAREGDADRE